MNTSKHIAIFAIVEGFAWNMKNIYAGDDACNRVRS